MGKIQEYLSVKKEKNDKSKFLFSLGYSTEQYHELLNDIKDIATNKDIILEKTSEFGKLYFIKGTIKKQRNYYYMASTDSCG